MLPWFLRYATRLRIALPRIFARQPGYFRFCVFTPRLAVTRLTHHSSHVNVLSTVTHCRFGQKRFDPTFANLIELSLQLPPHCRHLFLNNDDKNAIRTLKKACERRHTAKAIAASRAFTKTVFIYERQRRKYALSNKVQHTTFGLKCSRDRRYRSPRIQTCRCHSSTHRAAGSPE